MQFESLELRALLTTSSNLSENAFQPQLSHGGLCTCPICTGRGLDQIPAFVAPSAAPSASSPLSSLPQLHSNPLATAKLFLDFDGHFEASWGGFSNVNTPVFDQDGNGASLSTGELASINEIWARVSEDYAPFNIDVTTVDPGTQADRVAAVIAIGGSASDWYDGSAGGVAYVGGFFNGAPNVGYAFANNLGSGNPKYVAEAAAHEAGHLFGLEHQAVWSGSTLVAPYNYGDSNWAPLMGVGYYASRTTWYNGPTPSGPTAFQDDLAILSGANNGFGYQPDDYGDSIAAASSLPASGGNVNLSGLIGRNGDADYWSFSTAGGTVNFQLSVAAYGPNLDAVLELRDSTGQVIVTAAPATSQSASISTTLGAGTYYLSARSNGDYGDLGQYTITGTVVGLIAAPEITIKQGATSLSDGQTVNFGSTTTGAPITQSFTIANDGTATLTLSSLTSATLPAGFSLASDLGTLSLTAGQSTTFSLRLNAAAAGTFSGTIQIANNDSDENPFDLTLTGTVAAAPTPTLALDAGAGAAGSYAADQFFSGGSTYTSGAAINTSGVTNPAPASVYQSERNGNFTYTLPGMTPGAQYTVRLHFAEVYWTSPGTRLFNVQINGTPVLTNFDIVADAGGAFKADVKSFTATADAAGKITISFVTIRDNAKLSGLEILSTGPITPNAPPAVATVASATPNPVTGTTANLSVLGNDADTGESSLTYTWSVVSGPAGAPAPTFSANGTNAAKNSTATFFKAGSYTLRATLTDPSAASVTSDVSVTVNQTATSVTVTPGAASIINGGTQAFTATLQDQFGTALSSQPSVSWTIDSGGVGSINASGLYTAPSSGTGVATVRATSGSLSGTASVTITAASAPTLALAAGAGGAGSYAADQFFSGGSTYTSGATINTSGVTNPAPARVYQSERNGNFTYTLPGMTPGAQYTVRLHFAEIYWTSPGIRLFNVQINGTPVLTNFDIVADAGGAFKADVKSFTATADAAGKITINFVTVRDNAKLSGIEILSAGPATPTPPTIVTAASATPNPVTGTTANLSVLGNDADTGESSLTYTWSVVSGPAGAPAPTFSASGTNAAKNATATFFKAGSYTLRATLTDPSAASVTSDVSVTVNQTATSVTVTPAAASIVNGGTQSFAATVLDQFGAALSSQPSVSWTIDSGGVGSINASGLYTAPSSGTGVATVRATSGSLSGTASVTVTAPSSLVLAVDAGGGAAGSYATDQFFSGGSTYTSGAAINTGGVTNPAPASVYQSERNGNFTYSLPGLTPGAQYTVRLHFAEIYWNSPGIRLFNVQINGSPVLTNFDIFADAGGAFKADVKSFTATADAAGKITISFVTIRDNAKLSGLEILSASGSLAASSNSLNSAAVAAVFNPISSPESNPIDTRIGGQQALDALPVSSASRTELELQDMILQLVANELAQSLRGKR